MERRLAAILAADVVGYSRLIRADEEGTLMALKALRADLIGPKLSEFNGRIVKLMGDGMLVEFASVVDAVRAAVKTQQAIAEYNSRLPGERRIDFRIGINLGDVVIDGDDIQGDGVNVAARLEGLAEPGGICVSGAVYEQVRNRIDLSFEDLGDRRVKNIDQPVRVWSWPETATRSKPEVERTQDATPIILVEKFSYGSDDNASADLAEELRNEILDTLGHRTGVRVATPAEGGQEPTYLLKGRCRVIGDRCRLNLSMTIAANGESFWSTKIDREITDLFDFLDDVVAKISTALRVRINAYAGAVYASRPDESLTVQQLLSKAAHFFYHVDEKSVEISRRTMEVAVAKAPENPMALAMHAYAIMQTVPLAIERVEDIGADEAISFADRSVYHGSNVDFVFRNRGRIRLWLRRDHEGCRADSKRALAINPNYHMAREDQSLADIFDGQFERGIPQLGALLEETETDPFHTPYRQSMLGIAYAMTGDSRAAIDHARDGYERKPFVPIHALVYAIAASEDETLTRSTEFRDMLGRHGLRVGDANRFPFASEIDTAAVANMLRKSGLPE